MQQNKRQASSVVAGRPPRLLAKAGLALSGIAIVSAIGVGLAGAQTPSPTPGATQTPRATGTVTTTGTVTATQTATATATPVNRAAAGLVGSGVLTPDRQEPPAVAPQQQPVVVPQQTTTQPRVAPPSTGDAGLAD